MTINYSGGCFNRYYFNVYKNSLNPAIAKTDLYCTTRDQPLGGNVLLVMNIA
jgi:hypothetical protein